MKIEWSEKFTYAVGLFTADGCLSSDRRHLDLTSKDEEQIINFINCLELKNNKIGRKCREKGKIKKYYRVQFSSRKLYDFFKEIGLMPRKSKLLKEIKIPMQYFKDFLRGLFDGDGSFHVFRHPESQYDQMRTKIASASPDFLRWLHKVIKKDLSVRGYISKGARAEYLEFATEDSLKVLKYMYYPSTVCLSRKFDKIKPYLKQAGVAELV